MKVYNFPWVFILGAVIALTILVMSIVFLLKAMKRGREIGMTKNQLKTAITSSAIFSIVPSIPIVIGIGIMMQFLGLAVPWIRLTVVGALQYEIAAVFSVGGEAAAIDPAIATTATLVMTLGIVTGLILNGTVYKKYQGKLMDLQVKSKKKMDNLTGALLSGMLGGMISSLLVGGFFTIGKPVVEKNSGIVTSGEVTLITLATSMGIMVLVGVAMKVFKQKWLENYALPVSMLGAMIVAFFVHPVFV